MSVETSTARTVTVATVQFEPIVGDRVRNLAAIERLVKTAKTKGAETVVLPELADSGYTFRDGDEVAALAGPVPDGPGAKTLCRLAEELGLYIVSGVAEQDGDRFYNSALLCGPEGYIGKYRKLHLWNNENRLFRQGDLGLPVFDLPFGRIRTRVRTHMAQSMLTHTSMSITEIALYLGYSESSAFSRSFKQQVGTTPASYRTTHRCGGSLAF
ncbi:nitrilase-related carbon-nitrogen hydrolase [Rhizobium sp. BR 249]|uniref:nitrilase-related carbon-nitrogen hydrolase n=1 Tax=Rhizobium sp. BR 249 TaxID=3040011 RepID=UPI0039BF52AE